LSFVDKRIRAMAGEDLEDYTIIKEGEAEILMNVKNQVFYNKTQVPKSCLLFFCWLFYSKFV
jgi:hypothetical protein